MVSFVLLPVLAALILHPTFTIADVGDVVCRYTTKTSSSVDYYTCTELSQYYGISLDTFYKLNPSIDRACDTIKPDTEYCVDGYIEVPVSSDGFCGPQHGNATCIGTDKQCCNSATWKCGDSTDDCAAGTCYEGACLGNPAKYSLDGNCGPKTGDKICTGKWGACCNQSGKCGSGTSFCAKQNCLYGACEAGPSTTTAAGVPWQTGTTPDGSCGGTKGYTCDIVFGACCSPENKCGSRPQDCGTGCQSKFGTCNTPAQPAPSGISPDGSCGGSLGYRCLGSTFGDCCSSSNFCGSTTGHCGTGCQLAFGTCSMTDPSLSPDGTCGGTKGYKCKGSGFGDCCSGSGFCGGTEGHCGAGCQTSFGICTGSKLSPDGTCGGANKYQCKGTSFGDCCSPAGFCGKSTDHCGQGCQPAFGSCSASPTSTSISKPRPTDVSTDGSCGGTKALKCNGSGFGECCSKGGFCGDTVNHCAQGCQSKFSSKCLTANVPTLDGACGSKSGGFTCKGGPFDGQCCSANGFCGTTSTHCGSGCQKDYGKCN